MITTFTTAKSFADAVLNRIGRSHQIELNKAHDETRSLQVCLTTIERLHWYVSNYEKSSAYRSYNNAIYGLNRSVVTGRANQYVVLAIRSMKMRQVLELIYELATFSDNIEEYGMYLNQKFTPALV